MEDEIQALEQEMLEDVASMLTGFASERGNLVPILQKIQERHSYLDRLG